MCRLPVRVPDLAVGNDCVEMDRHHFKMGHGGELCNKVLRVELGSGWKVQKCERDEALGVSE